MWAICFKELKSYFKSFFGWLFLAGFILFAGFYFVAQNVINAYPYISYSVSSVFIILIFLIPLLTMRAFSEEKKQKTDQLLLTAPVRLVDIVLGKFMALAIMMLIATAIFGIFTLIMSFYGSIPVVQSLLALLCLLLFGLLIISIGLFISTLTEHQFISALISYGFFIFMLLVPSLVYSFVDSTKPLAKVVSFFDYYQSFDFLLGGILNLNDIIKILSFIFVFLILTYYSFGKNSLSINFVGVKKFVWDKFTTLIIILLVVGINIGCSYIPLSYMEFDFTETRMYTISDKTKDLLENLNEDITIYWLADENNCDATIQRYLNQYDKKSKHIDLQYKPMKKYPMFYAEYTDTAPSDNSIIVVKGDDYRVLDYEILYTHTTSIDYSTYQTVDNITGVDVEGQVTAAISGLLNGDTYTIYLTEGHGEFEIYTALTDKLKKAGYHVDTISLLKDSIPENCVTLIVNGPETDFTEEEIYKIEDYIDKGGNVILMAAIDINNTDNYDKLMEDYGVSITDGTVLEDEPYNTYNNENYILLLDPLVTDISEDLVINKKFNVFAQTRGFRIKEDLGDEYTITSVVEPSAGAYSKVLVANTSLDKDTDYEEGPFSVCVLTEKYSKYTGETGKVLLVGSPYFLNENLDALVSYANSDLFINSLNMNVELPNNSAVEPKSYDFNRLVFPTIAIYVYLGVFCLAVPLTLIITGIVIIIVRSKK